MYRSSSKRSFSSSPRSITPEGTAVDPIGGPTAPSRIASMAAELFEDRVGQDLARALVAAGPEVVVDRLHGDAGGGDDLERLRDDLRADPVAPDHSNLVHAFSCRCR